MNRLKLITPRVRLNAEFAKDAAQSRMIMPNHDFKFDKFIGVYISPNSAGAPDKQLKPPIIKTSRILLILALNLFAVPIISVFD